MAEAAFRASGLASGLDTNFLVEQLTKFESIPLDRLRAKQSAFSNQVSALGDLVSKLEAFKTAGSKLSSDGGLGVKTTTTNDSFTATPGTAAAAGQYDIEITALATSARARSAGNTKNGAIASGTLNLSVQGTAYAITIGEGNTLNDIATAIKISGAPVTATVLNNGTQDFLSIVRKDSGYTVGSDPTAALVISPSQTGLTGEAVSFAETDPENASFQVNGLAFTRSSNVVTDAVPGTTLTLKKKLSGEETLLLENDTTQTASNLKGFVDTYNTLMSTVSANLRPSAKSDRQYSLAGDGALRSLQKSLQGVLTSIVGGQGNVRTLADIGFKTSQKDGTISIDTARLQKALETDSSAVNGIFSTATTGVSDLVDEITSRYTNSTNGILTSRKKGINSQIKGMDRQLESLSIRLDAYRTNLINQFSAMEKTISGLKTTGAFLTRQLG